MTDIGAPNDERETDAVRELVKRAFATQTPTKAAPDILRGVQRRLRARSRGKFFADGWSTTQARHAYVLVALATLLLVALAYYALLPVDVH
ncbi:MAG: hypothetical protein M3O46_15850 [Myxococcota bacterium]|nr:hypothetical protein [Myxococcota bacterium]